MNAIPPSEHHDPDLLALAKRLRASDNPALEDVHLAAAWLQYHVSGLDTQNLEATAPPIRTETPISVTASLGQVLGSVMIGFIAGFVAGYPIGMVLGWIF